MLTDVFIRRPVLSTVLSLLIILGGAIAIPTLPIARYPELAPPSVTVNAFYTGANAQAVESAVTTPLEQVINGVEGMTYIQSSSTNTGASDDHGDLRASTAIPTWPRSTCRTASTRRSGACPPTSAPTASPSFKNTAGFMGGIGFFSRDNRYDAQFISNYLDLYVRDAIKRVPGVGNVIIFGERRYAMRLWLDPAAGRRARADGQRRGQRAARAERPDRRRCARRRAGRRRPDVQPQRAGGRPPHRGRPVRERRRSRPARTAPSVRVRDVGRVELGAETYSSNLRFLGLEANGLGVQLLPSANALEVYDGVMAQMARLEKSFPPGLEWRLAFDNVGGRPRVDLRGAEDAGRGHGAGGAGDVPVPPELAQHASSRR